eukprot:6582023-Lingulodinium_polyedra.AAC.1
MDRSSRRSASRASRSWTGTTSPGSGPSWLKATGRAGLSMLQAKWQPLSRSPVKSTATRFIVTEDQGDAIDSRSPEWVAWIQQAIIEDDELFEISMKKDVQVPEVPD